MTETPNTAHSPTHETRGDLDQPVEDRTTELSKINEELRAAIRELHNQEHARLLFVDNASHELRTPLASMSYTIGNLLQNIAGPIPNRVREYLNVLKEECQRMAGTVTRILDLNRIDAATLELHRMKIPLCHFTQSTVEALKPVAAEKSQQLAFLPSEATTGFVHVDPLRVENVIGSILGNATEYTPDNGTIEVTVQFIRDDTWMEITVTDDGPGIPADALEHVTERYFRVGEFVRGTGLGLAFCKEILALHGGELDVVSPPPNHSSGTRVSIRLPCSEPLHVMAIDDSNTIRLIIQRLLTASGYIVQTYANADAALLALQEEIPEMIVVDSVMPGMHGPEFITRIKAMHELRPIPILMLTGAEVDRETRAILESYAVPVLGKPWVAHELIHALEEAIYGKCYMQS